MNPLLYDSTLREFDYVSATEGTGERGGIERAAWFAWFLGIGSGRGSRRVSGHGVAGLSLWKGLVWGAGF